jgi:drug/metabolite transporter (DMT)-like permease
MVIGAIIFKEQPDFYTIIGAGIIVVSGLYAFLREVKVRSSIEINTK